MPCFNSERFLADSIESVLKQTYENFELIIIDDASNDGSMEIVESYHSKDKRIKILRNDENSGPAVSRNKGIEFAKGRYIAFLDSDDLWNTDKLKKQIAFMKEKGSAMSHTSYELMTESGAKKGKIIRARKEVGS